MGRNGERGPGVGLLVGAVILLGLALFILSAPWATAQSHLNDDGHTEGHMMYHEQAYSHWLQPNGSGVSCCHAKVYGPDGRGVTGDCRPTQARLVGDHWRAKLDPDEQPGPEGDGWVTIPDGRILHEKNPDPTGQDAHLCFNYGMVYCFVPPTGAL